MSFYHILFNREIKSVFLALLFTFGFGFPVIFAWNVASEPSSNLLFRGLEIICGALGGLALSSAACFSVTTSSPICLRNKDSRNSTSRSNLYSKVSTRKP